MLKNHSSGAGAWTYRSYYNIPDSNTPSDKLELGTADLLVEVSKEGKITGKIYGDDWKLELEGFVRDGDPTTLNFRGSGKVGGHLWIYGYLCYIVPFIPEGKDQVPALVGAVTRLIDHPGINGQGPIHPAGVVGSFYAVLQAK